MKCVPAVKLSSNCEVVNTFHVRERSVHGHLQRLFHSHSSSVFRGSFLVVDHSITMGIVASFADKSFVASSEDFRVLTTPTTTPLTAAEELAGLKILQVLKLLKHAQDILECFLVEDVVVLLVVLGNLESGFIRSQVGRPYGGPRLQCKELHRR